MRASVLAAAAIGLAASVQASKHRLGSWHRRSGKTSAQAAKLKTRRKMAKASRRRNRR